MQKNAMSFVKGMGAGMIAGATVAIVGQTVIGNSGSISKGSAKVVKAAGDFIDGIQTMFR
ncbi:MAG: hypothetical protein MJ090_03335 [Clostridia bacterium]|nr:hypothetical protein [Clostridia bacterium]